jgi:hypothetical protein
MERSVNVNGVVPTDPTGFEDDSSATATGGREPVDQGPCLHFGPAGERCSRRAVEGGFCERHQIGGGQALSVQQISRRALAAIGVIAMLWPVLADLIRELIRLLR